MPTVDLRVPALVGLLCLLVPRPAPAQDLADVRLVAEPGVSATHIAFQYDGDLWVARRDGEGARRITTHEGTESSPRFSPDGRWLAFTGEYDGNRDVYVVAVDGGPPRRLTWHPGPDLVRDWTADGSGLFVQTRFGDVSQIHRVEMPAGARRQLTYFDEPAGGLSRRPESHRIEIRSVRTNGRLRLEVVDDGPGFDRDPLLEEGKGVGIRTTLERLRHLYGSDFRFRAGDAPGGGARIEVEIPWREETEGAGET